MAAVACIRSLAAAELEGQACIRESISKTCSTVLEGGSRTMDMQVKPINELLWIVYRRMQKLRRTTNSHFFWLTAS